jgi:hypothetical protein
MKCYSCSYNPDGEIKSWYCATSLRPLLAGHLVSNSSDARIVEAPAELYGLVAQFPKEVIDHDSSWALEHLKVSHIFPNGSVEVAIAR